MICHVTFVIYNFVLYHIHIYIICPIYHILICQRERRAETGGGCVGEGGKPYIIPLPHIHDNPANKRLILEEKNLSDFSFGKFVTYQNLANKRLNLENFSRLVVAVFIIICSSGNWITGPVNFGKFYKVGLKRQFLIRMFQTR